MPLAPLDVLVGVVAARVSRFFDGLDTLGVHDGSRRSGILAYPLALGCVHDFEDEGPQSLQSESSEMIVNGRPRGKVMGQKAPSTPTADDVEDGVKNIA